MCVSYGRGVTPVKGLMVRPLPGREVVPMFGRMTVAPRVEPVITAVWFAWVAAMTPVIGMKTMP
jgi:hypothetical protein